MSDGTGLDLDALAALEQAATPGPWHGEGEELIAAWANEDEVIAEVFTADAALIAALRNAAPDLIAAARERDELADSIDDYWSSEVTLLVHQRDSARRDLRAARAEVAALRERVEAVEALLSWGNGRDTGGVDRLIPAADVRAALATRADQ